jgi:hypothetical protein
MAGVAACEASVVEGLWRDVLAEVVASAGRRLFAPLPRRGGGGGGGGGGEGDRAADGMGEVSGDGERDDSGGGGGGGFAAAAPPPAAPLEPLGALVPQLTLSAELAARHGGAAQPLPLGNFRIFETLRQSLTSLDAEGANAAAAAAAAASGGESDGGAAAAAAAAAASEGRPVPLPPSILATSLAVSSACWMRTIAPHLLIYALERFHVPAGADAYAAVIDGYADARPRATIDLRAAQEMVRRMTAAGVSPTHEL